MTNRNDRIGFSQRVRLEWLEQTTNLVLAGNGKVAIHNALQELLKDKVSVGGQARGCNRDKVISILRTVWVTPRKDLVALRDDGLKFLSTQSSQLSPRQLGLAVHWGMAMATYPFWMDVATPTGRLLRLQGSAAATQVQRRVREQYGERETVSRAVRRVLRSYLDWGVLQNTSEKGVYSAGTTIGVADAGLVAWLVEAFLHAHANASVPLKEVIGSPSFFPFRITSIHPHILLEKSSRLELFHHGLDDDLILLKKTTSPLKHP